MYPPDPPETCRFCQSSVELVEDKEVYGRSYGGHRYLCRGCGAHVGVHESTEDPLGILADVETRRLRKGVHSLFDPLYKDTSLGRQEAYDKYFGDFPPHKRHVAMLTAEECRDVIRWLINKGPRLS